MKLLPILLISLVVMTFGGFFKKSKGSRSKKSAGSKKSSNKNSSSDKKSSSWGKAPSPRTPSTTDYIPTNDELCGCHQLDLVCAPIINNDEICYYYLIQSDFDTDYCKPISTLTLNTDNQCGLTAVDIDELLSDYAPKCYDIDPLDGDGIKLTLDSKPSSGNYGGSSKSSSKTGSSYSSKTDSSKGSSSKQSSSGTNSDGGSNSGSSLGQEDYIIFSMCFKAGEVAGFNPDGQIQYSTPSGGSYTCGTPDLPNFCGTPETTTPGPTTTTPTTSAPVTARPTTADPTSAAPTTVEPTVADTTTPSPVTAKPTTESPTTAAPVTAQPTTAAPTTAQPTVADTTTASPITSLPTTDQPTTAAPTTNQPTTANPTSAAPTTNNPTTAQPSVAPTFVECTATDAYNIAFLLDESGSVSNSEWDVIKNFVKRLIDFDVSPTSYVSLYEFASLPGFDRFLNFTGPKATEQAAMELALDRNRYTRAGQTETWDAVNRVLDDFYDYTIDPANQARGNILFLVTDGNPTDAAGDPTDDSYISDEYNTCDYIQNRLEIQFPNNYIDVAILVIDPDGSIDTSKIECLDYFNDQQDIIPIESFGSAAFTDIEARIREKICTEGEVPAEGSGPGTAIWTYPDGNVGLGPIPDANGGGIQCSNDPGAGPCTTAAP